MGACHISIYVAAWIIVVLGQSIQVLQIKGWHQGKWFPSPLGRRQGGSFAGKTVFPAVEIMMSISLRKHMEKHRIIILKFCGFRGWGLPQNSHAHAEHGITT